MLGNFTVIYSDRSISYKANKAILLKKTYLGVSVESL